HHDGVFLDTVTYNALWTGAGLAARQFQLTDLDGDSFTEAILAVKTFPQGQEKVFVYDLPGEFQPWAMPWAQHLHDPQNTSNYNDNVRITFPAAGQRAYAGTFGAWRPFLVKLNFRAPDR